VTYYQPPNQQQPQYPQQSQFQQSPQAPKKEKQDSFLRRNGGLLSVGASLATILTLFLTLGQQSGSTPPANLSTSTSQASNSVQVSATYPPSVQTSYLDACEADGTESGCNCTLTWLENNVPLQQYNADETQVADGVEPQDLKNALSACGF
jgi:hypothetical protein